MLFALALSVLIYGQANSQVIYEETFENSRYFPVSGSTINKTHNIENCNDDDTAHGTEFDWTLFRSTDISFRGNKCGQLQIRKDQPHVGSSQKIRSEVTIIKGDVDPRFTAEMWYSFAVYFPTVGFEYDDTREAINQWYEDGSDECTIRCEKNKAYLEVLNAAGTSTLLKYDLFATSLSGSSSVGSMQEIPKDEWHEFVFHFIHSTGTDGLIEVWRDGLKIHNITGQRTIHSILPKWKIGEYKASFLNGSSNRYSRVIYFDNIRVGDENATLMDMISTTIANIPPTSDAGGDKVVQLPVSTTTLTGSGNDVDGSIVSYAWTKVSGPSGGTISSPSSATTGITGLIEGTYNYQLLVTDNNGATGSDVAKITVNPASPPANVPPTAYAGPNQTIYLPTNSTNLAGEATDSDGTIVSTTWVKVSGPSTYTIDDATSLTPELSNLMLGTYVFRLNVEDNNGAITTDDVSITIAGTPSNPEGTTYTSWWFYQYINR